MRKHRLLLILLSASLALFSGCSDNNGEPQNTEKPTEKAANNQTDEAPVENAGARSQITIPDSNAIDMDALSGKNLIYADISVNPELGLFLDVDNDYTVVHVLYLNDDAREELSDTNLLNLKFEDAYREVVSELIDGGYVATDDGDTVFTSSVTFMEVDLTDTENILKPLNDASTAKTVADTLTAVTEEVQSDIAKELEEENITLIFEEKFTDEAHEAPGNTESYDGYIGLQLSDDTQDYFLFMFINGTTVADAGIMNISESVVTYDAFLLKDYDTVATDFISLVRSVSENISAATLISPEEAGPGYDTVRGKLENIIKSLLPDLSIDYITESDATFATRIEEAHTHENIDEPGGPGEPPVDYNTVYVSSEEELLEALENNPEHIYLDGDITLNVSDHIYNNLSINCEGYSVAVKGTWNSIGTDMQHVSGIALFDIGDLDLSELTINSPSYYDEYLAGSCYTFIEARGSLDITNPAGLPARSELSPGVFETIIAHDGSGAEDNPYSIYYEPALYTYDERHALELEMVTAILTNGDWSSCALFDKYDSEVWTDIVIDTGNATLADMDYSEIRIRDGGSLKVSGTIAITGGRLCFRIDNGGYLDITGLALTKKHPSPDMIKITFDDASYVDLSKLYPTATSGEIKFDSSADSFNITIW
ncbi:MAG: hypothetical protein K6F92_09550 [Lachnospiraceae bacterium]|nr:hypothetical protein [Lachnospiraceae bacterium]